MPSEALSEGKAVCYRHSFQGFAMTRVVIASVMSLILPFIFCKKIHALPSEHINAQQKRESCFSAKAGPGSTRGSNFGDKLKQAILNDPMKIQALSHAFSIACRSDLIDLSPTPKYQRLKELLHIGREEYESKGSISKEALRSLEQEVGVTKEDVNNSHGKILGWQLVIDKKAKDDMRMRTAASLASHRVPVYRSLSSAIEAGRFPARTTSSS